MPPGNRLGRHDICDEYDKHRRYMGVCETTQCENKDEQRLNSLCRREIFEFKATCM